MSIGLSTSYLFATVIIVALGATEAHAQSRAEFPEPAAIPTPASAKGIPLRAGGSDSTPENWYELGGLRTVRNVRTPALVPLLPNSVTATGAAVIVAPGGAFMMLSIDSEGFQVARWLADHGVAAFVLKYRLEATPPESATFLGMMQKRVASASNGELTAPSDARKDAADAVRLVRYRAAEWGVDPSRLGFLGFSAGAMLALDVALSQDAAARPDFIGVIYGPMDGLKVPQNAPPMFAAIAADDRVFSAGNLGLVRSWRAAGRLVELHMYGRGGHGFGMTGQGSSSDHWPEQFHFWLQSLGYLKRPQTLAAPPTMSPSTGVARTIDDLQCLQREPVIPAELLLEPRAEPIKFPSIDPATIAALRAALERDPGGLCSYRAANKRLPPPSSSRVVFIGDSITEGWRLAAPALFSEDVLNRGISGQTTSQMLLRFRHDVLSLRPRVVHIMGGINDINTPAGTVLTKSNIKSMVQLARANDVEVILASITPSSRFWVAPTLKPAPEIVELNAWLKSFAAEEGLLYVDYHSLLSDTAQGLQAELTNDGLHPNRRGYALMTPLASEALGKVLRGAAARAHRQ